VAAYSVTRGEISAQLLRRIEQLAALQVETPVVAPHEDVAHLSVQVDVDIENCGLPSALLARCFNFAFA
jgi:hypothetical protein